MRPKQAQGRTWLLGAYVPSAGWTEKWPKKQTTDLTAEQRPLALSLPAQNQPRQLFAYAGKMQENWHDKSPLKKCGCQQKCPLKKCGRPQKYHAPLESTGWGCRLPNVFLFLSCFSAARKVVRANYLHLCFRCDILYMCSKAHLHMRGEQLIADISRVCSEAETLLESFARSWDIETYV